MSDVTMTLTEDDMSLLESLVLNGIEHLKHRGFGDSRTIRDGWRVTEAIRAAAAPRPAEEALTMNLCETCRWWVNPDEFQISVRVIARMPSDGRTWRICRLISTGQSDRAEMLTGSDMSEMDDFITASDFGCVLWEAAAKEPA